MEQEGNGKCNGPIRLFSMAPGNCVAEVVQEELRVT